MGVRCVVIGRGNKLEDVWGLVRGFASRSGCSRVCKDVEEGMLEVV